MKTILGAVLVTIATTSACAQDIIGTWRYIDDIVKILYYSYKIRKKLEITHRLSRSTILYAYV